MTRFKEATFELPAQLSTEFDKESYRPESVERWLESLPITRRGETTKSLFVTLNTINKLDLPVNDRFEIMQMLCRPLDEIIDSLRNELSGKSYPLADKDIKIAELCSEMVSKMVIGYELILRSGMEKSWLTRRMQKGIWLASLYKLLFYFRTILCGYQLINRSAPKGLWRSVHALYLQTQKAGLHNDTIGEEATHTIATTIENTYKELILSSLMSRHQFRPEGFGEVQPLMGHFASQVQLRPVRKSEHDSLLFCISPTHDTPPLAMHSSAHLECDGHQDDLVFDSRELSGYLKRLAHSKESLVSVEGLPLHRDTVEQLYETWCHPHARCEGRTAGGGTVEISLGFTNTHHMILALAASSEQPGQDTVLEEDNVSMAVDYGDADPHRQIWSQHAQGGNYHILTADVVNHSSNGFCLLFTPPAFGSIRYGDALGVQRPGQASWDLARVCWLKSEEAEQMALGIEVIIKGIVPVDLRVRIDDNQRSDPIPALLGSHKSGALVLIMPYLPDAQSKRYELSYMEHLIPVDFDKQFLTTPSFIGFHIAEKALLSEFKTDEITSDESSVTIEKSTIDAIAVKSGHSSDDEYAELWEKL